MRLSVANTTLYVHTAHLRMRHLNSAGRSLLSFTSFNFGWWACALGQSHQMPWLGPLLMPFWIGLHLYFSPAKMGEAVFLLFLAIFGFLFDTVMLNVNIFYTIPDAQFAPMWLVSMWILFGFTFESMQVMQKNRWLISLAGVISGPLSYIFCAGVNILKYGEPIWIKIGIHGLIWAGLMHLLFAIRGFLIQRFS